MNTVRPHRAAPRPMRWWNSLSFRLALTVNVTALGVLGAFWLIDYRRERSVHRVAQTERLHEEAKVLRATRVRLKDAGAFQEFLDAFCRQMGVSASPGHHIAVFSAAGDVVARAHVRPNPDLEKMMSARRGPSGIFVFAGEEYLSAQVTDSDQTRIVVAQSMADVDQIIHAQANSRAMSLALLAVLIFGVTTIVVLYWVRDPLRELVTRISELGGGRFDVRVRPSGSAELRFLAAGVNEMAAVLELSEKQRATQMRRARAIQTGLLPGDEYVQGSFEVHALFHPADSVAGDLYDIVELDDSSTLVIVLDVSGHGVAAALYTALLRTVVRQQIMITADPVRIASAMNDEFAGVAGSSGEFVTCFLIRFDHAAGTLEYLGAGHDHAVIVRADGTMTRLDSLALPLGVDDAPRFEASSSTLAPGDRLYLYTDGLHEAADAGGRLYGRERLYELLRRTCELGPVEQLDAVFQNVRSHAGSHGFDDDVTLLCASARE